MHSEQWTDEIDVDIPDYPFVYSTVQEGVALMRKVIKEYDSIREDFDADQLISMIEHADLSVKQRETFDWFASRSPVYERRETGGFKSTRTRIVTQLAAVGGSATLSEMEEITTVSGTIVRDESVGRWITRKLIHDILVSNPAVTDACDDRDPRYTLDFAKYKKFCDDFDIPFTGPTQVKKAKR